MLGSEYNWLISFTRPVGGTPRIILARSAWFTFAVAVFCFLCIALQAEPAHVALLKEANTAAAGGNFASAILKLESARSLRPDYPRLLAGLARSYAAANRADDAVAQISELAAMGLVFDFSRDPAFEKLRGRPDFLRVTNSLAANLSPIGTETSAFTLPLMDGIIEGLAYSPQTHTWYFSDVRHHCVWVREPGQEAARKFSSDADSLLGVFGLKIDETRHVLWAGTTALPEMLGFTAADKGRAALVEIDLTTGRALRSYAIPADGQNHVLGDFALMPDGAVIVTDSFAPILWRLAPHATALEPWLVSEDFLSLQGVTLTTDGKHLIVSDYANGLWRIDPASRKKTLLSAPAHTTLFGIDGLYAVTGGLIAIQNGVTPQRVIRIDLDPSGNVTKARTLQSGHRGMDDLALGQVSNGRFHFIGNSGWSLYEKPNAAPAPRSVTIFTTVE